MEKAGKSEKIIQSPQELLEEGKTIQLAPCGYSMYPFLNPDKGDQVVIEPLGNRPLGRGDVVLYRRKGTRGMTSTRGMEGGLLILHRIAKIDGNGYYMVGDNQSKIEGPIAREQLIGIMTARVRGGRRLELGSPGCRIWGRLWLLVCPVRDRIKRPLAWMKRWFHGISSGQ